MNSSRRLIDLTMPFARENRVQSWYVLLSTLVLTLGALAGRLVLEIIRRLRLKLWDEKSDRLIAMREFRSASVLLRAK